MNIVIYSQRTTHSLNKHTNYLYIGKALTPKWEQLAKKIKDKGLDKTVVIAKMDATANGSMESVTGFPKLILFIQRYFLY